MRSKKEKTTKKLSLKLKKLLFMRIDPSLKVRELPAVDTGTTEKCLLSTNSTVLLTKLRVTSAACLSLVSSAGLSYAVWPEKAFMLPINRK